ncbi:MAG: hypothetical protein U0936_25305 [Planctomycetaceae bacterium]
MVDFAAGPKSWENLVRVEIQKATGTPDPPLLRQKTVARISRLLRGTEASAAEQTLPSTIRRLCGQKCTTGNAVITAG